MSRRRRFVSAGLPRALDQYEFVPGRQPPEALHDRWHERSASIDEILRREPRPDGAVHDDLCDAVALGLQEHRVVIDARFEAGGQRLQRLGPADLAAGADGRVVRHVLRFERRDVDAATPRCPAETGDEHGFADVGARALDHQRARRHNADSMRMSIPRIVGRDMCADAIDLGQEPWAHGRWRPVADDPAVAHEHEPVRHPRRERHLVQHDQRAATVVDELPQPARYA